MNSTCCDLSGKNSKSITADNKKSAALSHPINGFFSVFGCMDHGVFLIRYLAVRSPWRGDGKICIALRSSRAKTRDWTHFKKICSVGSFDFFRIKLYKNSNLNELTDFTRQRSKRTAVRRRSRAQAIITAQYKMTVVSDEGNIKLIGS